MYNTIQAYLDALKTEMNGADAALIQDAQADASEYLHMALQAKKEKNPDVSIADALTEIVQEYGTPAETAAAYKEIERRTSPAMPQPAKQRSIFARFFGVYIEPRTWGALLFMFIALVTGIFYFTWVVTGVSLSLSLLILIIGIPIAILFLLSVHGLAWLEGRLLEALLGVRMPRRPPFAQPGLKWTERLKALLTDKHTWLSMLYMVFELPLGVFYFVITTVLLSLALGFIATPFAQIVWHQPMYLGGNRPVFLPYWALGLIGVGGFFLLTGTLHLLRGIGALHARYAKWMLVS